MFAAVMPPNPPPDDDHVVLVTEVIQRALRHNGRRKGIVSVVLWLDLIVADSTPLGQSCNGSHYLLSRLIPFERIVKRACSGYIGVPESGWATKKILAQ